MLVASEPLRTTQGRIFAKTSQDVVLLFRVTTSVIHVVWRDDLRAKIDPDDHSVRVGGDNQVGAIGWIERPEAFR
jgi:hypothetical protein